MTTSASAPRASRAPRFITAPTRGVLTIVWGTTVIVASVIQVVGILAFAGAERLAGPDHASDRPGDREQSTVHHAEVVPLFANAQP